MSLYIAAWRSLATVNGDTTPIVNGHLVFEDVVTVGGGSLQSDPVTTDPASPAGYYARLCANEACHVAIGQRLAMIAGV